MCIESLAGMGNLRGSATRMAWLKCGKTVFDRSSQIGGRHLDATKPRLGTPRPPSVHPQMQSFGPPSVAQGELAEPAG